jgi:hypothetical protein
MMQEGTQYTHPWRRVLFTNALNRKMLGPNPENVSFDELERTLRLCDSKHPLRHRTRTV